MIHESDAISIKYAIIILKQAYSTAWRKIKKARLQLEKEKGQVLSIKEFCIEFTIDREDAVKRLNASRKNKKE